MVVAGHVLRLVLSRILSLQKGQSKGFSPKDHLAEPLVEREV